MINIFTEIEQSVELIDTDQQNNFMTKFLDAIQICPIDDHQTYGIAIEPSNIHVCTGGVSVM